MCVVVVVGGGGGGGCSERRDDNYVRVGTNRGCYCCYCSLVHFRSPKQATQHNTTQRKAIQ